MNLAEKISIFNCNTEIFFGVGAIRQLSKIISLQTVERILIICDEGVKKAGILDLVLQEIKQAQIDCIVFSEVEANPSSTTVNKASQILMDSKADLIVAVGGGSPLDTAKAVGVVATNGGDITQYEGIDKFEFPSLPVVAVPTTAGTASEVTNFTVITDLEREYKVTIGGRKLAARWAIVDPVLTLTLPPKLTASTGLDALVHAIESYTSTMAYPLSEALALEAIRVISDSLRQAVYNGDNLEARTKMLYGSLVAGMAFNNTRLGNVHAMSHPLSAKFNVPHGVANSVLLPHVMEFNRMAAPGKFARIAIEMNEVREGAKSELEMSKDAITAVQKLASDIGIPDNFRDYGVTVDSIPGMAQDAMKSGNILVNPRKTSIEDVITLYHKTL
ncbi:iron-containing alcohol dehydrogenase [Aneurinibacillus danicus]|jgi:alcohol dehydrogenase class IV|uniref:Alcohol dehydrogenase n=1 Tax=Aneurinibacillus danicus TaxID=267746 RepID=A0A511VD76_9BACL|nr:iron-containing alcohol dehydrogenase [Aneurinibacillus danicus]GEN36847.1 alcohol dehydrogenase [Aneurinibacillus danicus]